MIHRCSSVPDPRAGCQNLPAFRSTRSVVGSTIARDPTCGYQHPASPAAFVNCLKLQRERPDVTETLTQSIWYFDRKGEKSEGQEDYIRTQILYVEPTGQGRVYCKIDPYYVRSLTRFSDTGAIPPLSDRQQDALHVLEETCQRLSLHMVPEVGDIQWLTNTHVLHSRTAYKDHAPPTPRRHLMRLWLSTPEGEGGWALPFPDSGEKKRGGVQVNDTPPKYPLTGE